MSTYTGPWINWSHGAIRGSTITLSSQKGGLLISFLAIYVSVAGAAIWKICSFTLHQLLAKDSPQDALHQQRQVILCNTSSPTSAAYELLQLMWAWRKNAQRSKPRTLPFAVVAMLVVVLFGLASIFSSQVTKAPGNEVLITSHSCGTFLADPDSVTDNTQWRTKNLNDTKTALSYSRDCYGSTSNPLSCNQYVRQRLTWKINADASCPFPDRTICIGGKDSAYEMDTGLLDSHYHLGINTPKSQRLSYRKVTTCSPIHTEAYSTVTKLDLPGTVSDGDVVQYLDYGPIVGSTNYTYMYNTHTAYLDQGYTLSYVTNLGGTSKQGWIPIPALQRPDADVSLIFLTPNSVKYSAPVTDPWFHATTSYPVPEPGLGRNVTLYDSDSYVYALACTDQHQYCSSSNTCTPLTASQSADDASSSLNLNAMQKAIRDRLALYSLTEVMIWSVYGLGNEALRATDTLFELVQGPLPDNQWTIEVSAWMATSLARLQQLAVQYATGPAAVTDESLMVAPNTTEGKSMCRSQKVRSASGTISFSVLGVAIILIVGTILISLTLVLSTIVQALRLRFKFKEYKCMQYLLDDKFQLHRLAYEEAGQGHWSQCTNSIPITEAGEKLGVPADVDARHPRLNKRSYPPGTEMEDLETSSLMEQKRPRVATVHEIAIATHST